MPALPSSLICSLSQAPAVTAPETTAGLPAALASLPDPRARRGVRHQLIAVVTAAVCAVVAGCRSYTAIGEWVADAPAATVTALGMDPARRPWRGDDPPAAASPGCGLAHRRDQQVAGQPGGCGPSASQEGDRRGRQDPTGLWQP